MDEASAAPGESAAETEISRAGWRGWIVPGTFAVGALWVAYAIATYGPHDIAPEATVITSRGDAPAEPAALVDGDHETIALDLAGEEPPFVTFDLGSPRAIDQVVIHRRDGRGPLQIEISVDGELYGTYGRRGGNFDEWTAKEPARARYVRIRRPDQGRLRLTEVELISP